MESLVRARDLGMGTRACALVRRSRATRPVHRMARRRRCAATRRRRGVALVAWRLAGMVRQSKAQNVIRYELAQPAMWRQLTAEQPDVWPRWTHLLPLLANACDAVVRSAGLSTRVRRVEGKKILDDLDERT